MHRSETILSLLQLQGLGPGLYTNDELGELLGLRSNVANVTMLRLRQAGLVRYEGWPKKGRLLWWIADWDQQEPHPDLFPRWVLRANAAKEAEILFGQQRQAAHRLNVNVKTLSNFLCHRYCGSRLLGEWEIKHDPIDYVKRQ